MNKLILSSVATLGLVAPAAAFDSHVAWHGYVTVVAATAGCAGHGGLSVGEVHGSIYRAGLTPTDASGLSILFRRGTISLTNDNENANQQMRGTGTATARAVTSRALSYNYAQQFLTVRSAPANVLPTTRWVWLKGTLVNIYNIPNCNITFEGNYTLETF